MTSFVNRKYKQNIVYWSLSGKDGFGKTSYDAPIEIKGRWLDKETTFIDNTGRENISDTVIHTTQVIQIGDWVFLGLLTDIASAIDETDPNKVSDAREIRDIQETTSLKNKSSKLLIKGFL